jgi:hypothetical protein
VVQVPVNTRTADNASPAVRGGWTLVAVLSLLGGFAVASISAAQKISATNFSNAPVPAAADWVLRAGVYSGVAAWFLLLLFGCAWFVIPIVALSTGRRGALPFFLGAPVVLAGVAFAAWYAGAELGPLALR